MTELPSGPFNVIYADPAWRFATYSEKGKGRAPEKHYGTMSIDEICAMPVKDIAADNAALFLWVYQPMLPHALDVIRAWGFDYKTVGYFWFKLTGGQDRLFYGQNDLAMGLGYHTRTGGCEQCWIATRGKGYERLSKGERQTIFAPVREHSRKPDEVAESIVRLCGDVPRIELFARTRRPGWEVWGNQADKFTVAA